MFLASTTLAGGAPASDAYRSSNKTLVLQEISIVASVVTASATTSTGLSAGRQTGIVASMSQSILQNGGSASTQTTLCAPNRMIYI